MLFFFQMPQIRQQEQATFAATNAFVGKIMFDSLQMADKAQASRGLTAIGEIIPGYPQLATLATNLGKLSAAESNAAKVLRPAADPKAEKVEISAFCEASAKDLADLQASMTGLNEDLADEAEGRGGRIQGRGTIYSAIKAKIEKVKAGIAEVQKNRSRNGC